MKVEGQRSALCETSPEDSPSERSFSLKHEPWAPGHRGDGVRSLGSEAAAVTVGMVTTEHFPRALQDGSSPKPSQAPSQWGN